MRSAREPPVPISIPSHIELIWWHNERLAIRPRREFLRGTCLVERGNGPSALLPSGLPDAVGSLHHTISELKYPAYRYPCPTLQVQPYDCPRMARGQGGSLHLPLYDSFIRYSMPVYPGAIQARLPAP